MVSLTAITAVGSNGVIGDGHDLPWRIPADFRRFKQVTMGGVLVVGRKTHESMGLLPGRASVVLTRDRNYEAPGATVVHSVLAALDVLASQFEGRRWWCAGGGEVYKLMWPCFTHLDLTMVDQAPKMSVVFPTIEDDMWTKTSHEQHEGFAFVTYERRQG